jgi:lipopolysaccharide transport system permease protein
VDCRAGFSRRFRNLPGPPGVVPKPLRRAQPRRAAAREELDPPATVGLEARRISERVSAIAGHAEEPMNSHPASLSHFAFTVWRYWNLISRLIGREFKARYRGSVLGVVWAILTPVFTVLVFTFVFSVVFKTRWGAQNASNGSFVVILLLGLTINNIFAESIARAPGVIVANLSYVKKVVFPLEVLPVVVVIGSLVNACFALAIVIVANFFITGVVHPTLVFLPLVLAPYILLVIGVTLFFSSVGVFIRDLGQIVGLLITIMLFMTPIFYPLSSVPEPYRRLLYLNPLTFTVEQARAVSLFGALPDWRGICLYSAGAVAVLAAGLFWFQRTRNGFADVM